MNRISMIAEIAKRVPMLAMRDKDEWRKAESDRKAFVRDYPLSRIPALSLDEYVIGKGRDNRSFCYRLEREMDTLGVILGATALKFGVYYGRTKRDPTMRYRFASHWGKEYLAAFRTIKASIYDLLAAEQRNDKDAVRDNRLSPMFKGKLLFLYFPDRFAPIYAKPHLTHFVAQLNLPGSFTCETDMQRALMTYRNAWPTLKTKRPALYMRFLYDLFGYPDKKQPPGSTAPRSPLLEQAVEGGQFIGTMPPSSPAAALTRTGTQTTTDYIARQQRYKTIGDRGEAIVLAMERRRLSNLGKLDLSKRIKHVSQEDDAAGYDILSFDDDGTERPIEVKATTANNLDRGFYISANELDKAKTLPNFHLYIVFAAMSRNPRVLSLRQPDWSGTYFQLKPETYHATLSPTNSAATAPQ